MIESGKMRETTLRPEDFGFQSYRLDELTCDSVEETHRRAERILVGEGSDAENAAVAMNAGLAASVFHGHGELPDWSERALAALRAGEVQRLVQRYRELDQQ
jgi:anthranilate phosphoribosyltransferase